MIRTLMLCFLLAWFHCDQRMYFVPSLLKSAEPGCSVQHVLCPGKCSPCWRRARPPVLSCSRPLCAPSQAVSQDAQNLMFSFACLFFLLLESELTFRSVTVDLLISPLNWIRLYFTHFETMLFGARRFKSAASFCSVTLFISSDASCLKSLFDMDILPPIFF